MILKGFLASDGKSYISGETLARECGVTRASVWQHVAALKNRGFVIESIRRKGHRLVSVPDTLDDAELAVRFERCALIKKIIIKDVIESTNSYGFALASQGSGEGTLIVARRQTSGRGKLGRKWYSEKGGSLAFSIILRPKLAPSQGQRLTIAGAVAVAAALRDCGADPVIKWPNDIYIKGKKNAGILCEVATDMDRIEHAVLGIGVNVSVRRFPDELKDTCTSLHEHVHKVESRARLIEKILRHFAFIYPKISSGKFNEVAEVWESMTDVVGTHVTVTTPRETVSGTASGIDADGGIQITLPNGKTRVFYSGDITKQSKK